MNLALKPKPMLMPLKRIVAAQIGNGFGGLQLRRCSVVAGPPRFRISTAQKLILGWGSMLSMMIIPVWSLYQLPYWSALHNNLPWDEDYDSSNSKVQDV